MNAAEIASRYPRVLRRVGGYNLDAFVDPSRPVDMTKLMVGSEGTLAAILEAKVNLVALPAAKAEQVGAILGAAELLETPAAR